MPIWEICVLHSLPSALKDLLFTQSLLKPHVSGDDLVKRVTPCSHVRLFFLGILTKIYVTFKICPPKRLGFQKTIKVGREIFICKSRMGTSGLRTKRI